MAQPFVHLILTRFNVETSFAKNQEFVNEKWLDERLALFVKYCLPSIQHQSNQSFKWLVFIHPETPNSILEQLQAFENELDNMQLVMLRKIDQAEIGEQLQEYYAEAEYLLTTRFDSDDAIHPDFVKHLHKTAFNFKEPTLLNFKNGAIVTSYKVLGYVNECNPFISLLEPAKNTKTVLYDSFREMPKYGELYQIHLPFAYLQVVHGSNAWNHENGYWLSPKVLQAYSWLNGEWKKPPFGTESLNWLRFLFRMRKGG
ncbi:MAG: hypothetical protein KDC92_12285 [Bacteroidetes bacterium]|nr:hypothetical protein [Bacteroidota bacterium]